MTEVDEEATMAPVEYQLLAGFTSICGGREAAKR